MDKNNQNFFSVAELAKRLGISRVAVFKKIKKGQILAQKVGRSYVINKNDVSALLGESQPVDKNEIDQAIKKVVDDYGETLRLLGQE